MNKNLISAALAIALAGAGILPASAQTSAALTGQVTSAEEGAMEGVLVSAKKAGSTVTITVVSDAQGNYSFPAAKLEPGQYSLRIRAVGYDLDRPANVSVAAQQPAKQDLKLRKTEDLAAQLSNGEWLASFPGNDQQKNAMLGCVGCHTLERVARSTHKPDDFIHVTLPRMQGYVNQSIPAAPQLRRGERRMEERGDQRVQVYRGMADFLGSVNLSSGSQWKNALKPLPRPKGRSTRVVITEYDLPRETIQPHDVVVDADGIAWYSSLASSSWAGSIPRPARPPISLPLHKPGFPTGSLGLRTQGRRSVARQHVPGHDGEVRSQQRDVQILPAAPRAEHRRRAGEHGEPAELAVDGKVWSQNNGFAGVHASISPPARSRPGSRSRTRPRASHTTSTTWCRNPRATSFSPTSARSISAASTPRPARSSCLPSSRRARRAAQPDGRAGPALVRRISRRQDRHARHQDGKFTEWAMPTRWTNPYDVTLDKTRKPGPAPCSTTGWCGSIPRAASFHRIPAAAFDQHPPRVRRQLDHTGNSAGSAITHGASIIKLEPMD